MNIRRAVEDDIPWMVELATERRRVYESYQPTFWRPSPDAKTVQAAFFTKLIANTRNAVVLVGEDAGAFGGFIIAHLTEAPPVYAPGGKTCLIDDFAVTGDDWSEAGRALLAQAQRLAKSAGAIQAVVVCGHLDEPKRNFLHSEGLIIAFEWFVKNL